MNGLHLIADLYGCRCDPSLLESKNRLQRLCVQACRDAGLSTLGAFFHQFYHADGAEAGVTGAVVLAESHLAIHTWPERGDVTLDVYVCNYSRDNSERAKALFDQLIRVLQPEQAITHAVVRGQVLEAA